MTATALINGLLRSPDQLRAVVEATRIISTVNPTNVHNLASETPETRNRYVLAIVSHKDGWSPAEEGCLFVFKYCKLRNTSAPAVGIQEEREELDIQRVLPIYGEFGLSMSQMRSDLRSPVPTTSNILEQAISMITLSITPAEGLLGQAPPLSFCTSDVDGLKVMVAECKRLKDASVLDANTFVNLAQSTTNFSWSKYYLAKRTSITALISVPQDLRQANQPLLERLSPACAGHSEDEHADIQLMRDDWIRAKAQEVARHGKRRLTLRLGTFNVNGKMPSQDLSSWVQGNLSQRVARKEPSLESKETSPPLSPFQRISPFSVARNPLQRVTSAVKSSYASEENIISTEGPPIRVDMVDSGDPDMFVFGFQELDLSTEALLYSTSTAREDAWCSAIFAALGEKGVRYEKLASRQLVGMLLVILVKKSLKECFSDVRTTTAGAGILGIMGNKGGTAIRLAFTPPIEDHEKFISPLKFVPGSTTLTFVDTHLAAFDDMEEKRNSDFHDLSRRLLFEGGNVPKAFKPSPSPMSDVTDPKSETDLPGVAHSGYDISDQEAMGFASLSIYDTDLLFWLANLNYRVDVPDYAMRRVLQDDDWDLDSKLKALLRFDQLKKAIEERSAFSGFREGNINHMPSYRFNPGLPVDRLGYDLKRRPAWTDRILYMHGATAKVTQLSYASYHHITQSDHRPVASDFVVDVDCFDVERYKAHVRKLFHELNHLDMESGHDKGGLKILETFIDFDKVYYGKPSHRKVILTNTGKAPCAFRFVPTQLGSPTHPEWLHIHPTTGILLANETFEVTLRAAVDNATAALLNTRPKDLSGTLILHTMFGRDHFISLSGEYQYTCFANKLSLLSRLKGPIRTLKSPNDVMTNGRSGSAPREIIRLVNWMMSNPASTNEIFISRGDENTIDTIRECLDTGEEFPYPPETSDAKLRLAFADTLLRFLDSLPEPVMPASLHPLCLDTSSRDEAFELLDHLPPASVNVWISLTAFLHYTCQCMEVVEQEAIIATIAPVLLKDDQTSLVLPISPKEKGRFLMFFIN